MTDYFERVENGLYRAAAEGRHKPWYRRITIRHRRALVVLVASLVVSGSALAASGVFQTGAPVGPEVPPSPTTNVGVAIPSSVHLLALRIADPVGGPSWGLRTIKTTRGLVCVQLGRIVGGRIGVLGQDGAFNDDGRFHPLSINRLDAGAFNCATEDAHGHAFLNEEDPSIPAAGLIAGGTNVSGGCYTSHPTSRACPPQDRRNIYYGLLGPDATSISYVAADGEKRVMATAGPDGAYLVVLAHIASSCLRGPAECSGHHAGPGIVRVSSSGETGGTTLNAFGAVRAVTYRGGSSCRLPDGAEVEASERTEERALLARLRERYPTVYRKLRDAEQRQSGAPLSPHERSELESLQRRRTGSSPESPCPAVGYAPLPTGHITSAQIAAPIHVRFEPSSFYCEKPGEEAVPCNRHTPAGDRRIPLNPSDPEELVVISFRTRIAIKNYDRHYEINIANPTSANQHTCPEAGGGSFGPSNSDFTVGQEVRFDQFFKPGCTGRYRVTIGLVTVNGPSAAMPVPGLPGQSAEVPVGQTEIRIDDERRSRRP